MNQTPTSQSLDFVNHSYDYKLDWSPLSPITIINQGYTNGIYGGQFSSKISKTKLWKEQNKYE